MKSLLSYVSKGGVGKTMLTCQLARYASSLGLKVLVMDFDDQMNTTRTLERGSVASEVTKLPFTLTDVFLGEEWQLSWQDNRGVSASIAVLSSGGNCVSKFVEYSRAKEKSEDGEEIEIFKLAYKRFAELVKTISDEFDFCLIDSAPQNDVRVTIAMGIVDAVICPVNLAQESIEGMAATLNGHRGILRIKETVNPELNFLGFLPNMVEATQKQKDIFKDLAGVLGQHLLKADDGIPVCIRKRESLSNAQGQGLMLADLAKSGNTAAREAWKSVKPVFDLILARLGLEEKMGEVEFAKQTEQESKRRKAASENAVLSQQVVGAI